MLLAWRADSGAASDDCVIEPAITVPAHDGCAACLAVEGEHVATGGFDGVVRLWRLDTSVPARPQLRFVRQVRPSPTCDRNRGGATWLMDGCMHRMSRTGT